MSTYLLLTYIGCCCSSDFEVFLVMVNVITPLAANANGAAVAAGPFWIFGLLLDSDLELLCWKRWK